MHEIKPSLYLNLISYPVLIFQNFVGFSEGLRWEPSKAPRSHFTDLDLKTSGRLIFQCSASIPPCFANSMPIVPWKRIPPSSCLVLVDGQGKGHISFPG